MSKKVVKLNTTKKIRYLFDKLPSKTPEGDLRLQDMVLNHFGSFIGNCWEPEDAVRWEDALDNSGMSVEEFLAADWSRPKPKVKKRRKKV